jgi:hypothetical protein
MTVLKVLLNEAVAGAGDAADRALHAAGHDVARCTDPGAPAFPCAGMRDLKACPIRTGTVDVALTVRDSSGMAPTRHEEGALCALRHHVPLVVVGDAATDPFLGWESAFVGPDDDIVAACERAASSPLRAHSHLAAAAARDVVVRHGDDRPLHAVVRRDRGRLLVEITGRGSLSSRVRHLMAVRVIGALREFDPDAAGIDVNVGFEDTHEGLAHQPGTTGG